MNIETKTVGSGIGYEEYLNFGWQHTEDVRRRSGRSHHTVHVLARDKDMPHYYEIVNLEADYFGLKLQKKHYKPIDGAWCLVAFLCFLVPGIIYVTVKSKQKKRTNSHNREIQKQMDAVLAQVRPLL